MNEGKSMYTLAETLFPIYRSITGEGVIDGNGGAFFGETQEDGWFPAYKYGIKLHPLDRDWFRPGPMVPIQAR